MGLGTVVQSFIFNSSNWSLILTISSIFGFSDGACRTKVSTLLKKNMVLFMGKGVYGLTYLLYLIAA